MLAFISIRKILLLTASFITVVILYSTLYAGVRLTNTIDPSADVINDGRAIVLTGPLQCSEPENTGLRVTVTQRSTGAVAEGQIVFECSTTLQQWKVVAHAIGQERFIAGPAVAVAMARTRASRGVIDDAHQWLVNVTLHNR